MTKEIKFPSGNVYENEYYPKLIHAGHCLTFSYYLVQL
jgi:hypothetical protein